MSATPDSMLADPEHLIADLQYQLAGCRAERDEALQREAATAEVLGVISSSPGKLKPVFEALLANAVRICGGIFGIMALYENSAFRGVAAYAIGHEFPQTLSRLGRPPPGTGLQLMQEKLETVQVTDAAHDSAYAPVRTLNPAFTKVRIALHVPMPRDNVLIGAILIYRDQVQQFAPKQVMLVESVAKQAVVAIENARLLNETHEWLEQQTATANVLQVINASPGNLAPVFEALLEKAMRLCEASFGYLMTYDGERLHSAADCGHPAFAAWVGAQGAIEPEPGTFNARLAAGEDVVHIPDVINDPGLSRSSAVRQAVIEIGGFRTILSVALRKDNALLGVIHIYRQEVRPFTEKQIALLKSFAAQAVIAIENARLQRDARSAGAADRDRRGVAGHQCLTWRPRPGVRCVAGKSAPIVWGFVRRINEI